MSGPGRRFDPGELRTGASDDVSDADLAGATAMARELEALAGAASMEPSAGFADRVMTAVAEEAPPRLVVRSGRGRVVAFVAAVGEAWRVATSPGRPLAVRGQALAFALLVVVAAGSVTSVAAVGIARLLSTPPGPTPTVVPIVTDGPTTPPAMPTPSLPAPSPSPDPSPASTYAQPSGTDEPGETDGAGETDDPSGGTALPTDTARPTKTPRPTDTPRPTRTPKPTKTPEAEETPDDDETPEPDETPHDDEADDDHSGSGGSGGSGPG